MTNLLITHTVTDLAQWSETFSTFDEIRTKAGVLATRALHDGDFVAVDLEFASAAEATSFREFLETQVWPNSPHLGGTTPQVRVLEPVGASG